MANIDSQLAQLEDGGTDGNKARSILVDILDTLNTKGMNATSLGTLTPDHFVPKSEFTNKFNIYLRKIGLVYDFSKVVDENNKPTILTKYYKSGSVHTPFDVKGDTKYGMDNIYDQMITVIDNGSSGTNNTGASTPLYDVTLPTSNAVWVKLHYSDLQDLQDFING